MLQLADPLSAETIRGHQHTTRRTKRNDTDTTLRFQLSMHCKRVVLGLGEEDGGL